jgi:vacuolar-type H+-ATPase subunit E/Vma4
MAAPTNTLISLREYVDIRFEAQEKAVNAALTSAERAVSKAEMASEKRFESVNEFRAALGDSSRLLMPRSEAEQRISALDKMIGDLKTTVEAKDNKGIGISAGLMMVVVGISVIVNIVMVLYYIGNMHK